MLGKDKKEEVKKEEVKVEKKAKPEVKAVPKACDELFKVGDVVELKGQKFKVREVRGLDVTLEGEGLR
jgi:hypothetical protein